MRSCWFSLRWLMVGGGVAVDWLPVLCAAAGSIMAASAALIITIFVSRFMDLASVASMFLCSGGLSCPLSGMKHKLSWDVAGNFRNFRKGGGKPFVLRELRRNGG